MQGHVAASCSVASLLCGISLFLLPALLVRLSSTLWWDWGGGGGLGVRSYTYQKKKNCCAVGLFNVIIEFCSSDSNREHVNSEMSPLTN